jgi:phosphoheptose isomerase
LQKSANPKLQTAEDCLPSVLVAVDLIIETFRYGSSVTDCQHAATEFVGQVTKEFERLGLLAIALTADTSFITAFANDSCEQWASQVMC